ncbi:uncharacterized protein LOC122858044 [Aphidius gifuensis]|uniref:uncharacterized protein LOC122858044 n=1 Tax=Aphidius gifuensis TaxID=684658 RepID=UPI001CDD6C96|nr:uncharacterized protein LOC122858044 [Aphidius gifuensis]
MASSDQDAISLQVSLPQMLDLALGTPEVGAFNFNLLHNFLHVVLHQIDLKNTKVEYRGDNANRIKTMVSSLKSGPSIALHEYSITDGSGNIFQRGENAEGLSSPVDIVAADKNNGLRMSKGTKQQVGPGAGTALESIIYVEPVLDGATPTGLAFKDLDDSVKRLQQQFQALEELATTPEMVERLKTSRTDPLSDMWHVININKRLDATEQGINKAMTMLQDLIKGDKIEIIGSDKAPEDVKILNDRITELEMNLVYLNDDLKNIKESQNTKVASTKNLSPTPGKSEHEKMPKSNQDVPTAGSKSSSKSPSSTSENKESSASKIKKSEPQLPITNSKSLVAASDTSSPKTSKTDSPQADNSTTLKEVKKEISSVSVAEESSKPVDTASELVSGSADSSKTDNKKEIIEAPGQQTTTSRAAITKSGSVIGNIDLSELKTDVDNIKTEMEQTKADISNMKKEVEKTKQDTMDTQLKVDNLSKSMENYNIPIDNNINTTNNSLENAQSSNVSSNIEIPEAVNDARTESGTNIQADNSTLANSTSNNAALNDAHKNEKTVKLPSVVNTQNSSKSKLSTPKVTGNNSQVENILSTPKLTGNNSKVENNSSTPKVTANSSKAENNSTPKVTANNSKIENNSTPKVTGDNSKVENNLSTPKVTGNNSKVENNLSTPKLKENNSKNEDKKSQLIDGQKLFLNLPGNEDEKIELMEAIRNIEIMYGEAIQNLEVRILSLEDSIKTINEKMCNLEDGLECSAGDGIQEIQELVTTIQGIQNDIEKINQTAARLCQEKEDRDKCTKGLSEQIELLKTVKADKEELQGALADKADAHTVNNKVSCDKFDTTCEDLTRCLDNTIAKLTHQEYIWQEALDSVQQEVEGKLDKIEISPIKEFVNTRLKLLQDKLKILFDKRRETEAAGTRKILTDVQCISCDKKTMMKVTESINYRSDPMPCSRAIKPYLIYELNQVKKQHKKVPSRTAIQFSPASPKRSKFDQMDKPSRDQICTRYCGGSHTITSPHQRIMRMGHFLAQWGPEAIQLGEGVVQGSDGQLYKSRPMPSGAVSRKPDPCDPCTCNETEVKKTSPVSRQSSDVTAAAPPKTSQISQNKTVSTTQATSRRQSIKKTANSSKGLHSTQSLQREPKSSSNVSPTSLTIKQEKSEEKFTPSPPISPQRTSITISKINEEEENDDESIEENYE